MLSLSAESSSPLGQATVDGIPIVEGFMKIRELVLADALLFAVLALTLAFVGYRGQNLYFLVAGMAFLVATYVTYPPRWMQILWGSKDD